MIAVAGYINYSDNHLGIDKTLKKASTKTSEKDAKAASETDAIVEEIEVWIMILQMKQLWQRKIRRRRKHREKQCLQELPDLWQKQGEQRAGTFCQ